MNKRKDSASKISRPIPKKPNKPNNEDINHANVDSYEQNIEKMKNNNRKLNNYVVNHSDHFNHHYDKKIQRKLSNAKAQIKIDSTNFPDKYEILKDQNIQLKGNHQQLEEQVKIIATRLKRQIQQLKQDRVIGGKNINTAQFESDLETLIDESIKLQEEEQRMMIKVKKLQKNNKEDLDRTKNLYSTLTAEQNQKKSLGKTDQLQHSTIEVLKSNVERSQKQLIQLRMEVQGQGRLADSTLSIGELMAEKRSVEMKLMHTKSLLEDVRSSVKVKEDIFKSGKGYEEQLFNQLKNLQHEQTELFTQQRVLETATGQIEDLRRRLQTVKGERDRMQSDFDVLMRQPFFREQADSTNLQNLNMLQSALSSKETEINKMESLIQKHESDTTLFVEKYKKTVEERDHFQEDLSKMRAHMDPSSISLNDIMRKLKNEDPNNFRQVMNDLQYQGKDPNWFKQEFMESLGSSISTKPSDIFQMRQQRDRLQEEKAKLVAELTKVQNLLKVQVDIDRQNQNLLQTQLNQVQGQIKFYSKRQADLSLQIRERNQELLHLQKQVGPSSLNAADLEKLNKELILISKDEVQADELRDELLVVTEESELNVKENLLDLRITTASYDRMTIVQILGGRDILPSQVRTFLSVDFYNHDSKNTDESEGFDVTYNTLFSFKNIVDDFYLKHLEKDSILVDVFALPISSTDSVRPNGVIKIGSARLPLHKIIDGDLSFQAQEIIHESTSGQLKVGKIFFQMKMRNSIAPALKWFNQNKMLKGMQANEKKQQVTVKSANIKIVEICVLQGQNFQISGTGNSLDSKRMQPFYSYDFYTFEVRSHTVSGSNPMFDSYRRFEVEATPQFMNYMKTQLLQIDLIDESVDLTQVGVRDYIGSVRIPLREVLTQGTIQSFFAVIDENSKQTGDLQVKITLYDKETFDASHLDESLKINQTSKIQFEVLRRIVTQFIQSSFDDLEVLYDILFMKDTTQQGSISQSMFKDFLLNDLKITSVTERDIDVFLKTHSVLSNKDKMTRQDLNYAFEHVFQEVKNSQMLELANGGNFQPNGDFGRSRSPLRVLNPFERSKLK